MGFEMQIVSNTPLVGEEDPEIVAKMFFEQIGYLSKGADPEIPYKLFADFLHILSHRLHFQGLQKGNRQKKEGRQLEPHWHF